MIVQHEMQPNSVSDVELDANALDQVDGVKKLVSDVHIIPLIMLRRLKKKESRQFILQ